MGSNAEENHQSGNCNPVTKSVGSSIKIDSISVDLVSSNDKGKASKCEHFSLRGYVSEIRQKDWSKCWPFSSDHSSNTSVEQTCMLPPLEVPKFKWWHCQHCLLEFDAKDDADNFGTRNGHSTSRLKSNTVCSHGVSPGDVSMLPSEFQEARKLDIVDGRNFDVNFLKLSTDYQPSSCRDKKENETEVVKCPNIGHGIGLEDEVSRKIPPLSYIATEDVSNLMQERHNPDLTVALCAQCNGSGNFCEPGCAQVEHADRNLNCMASINVSETCTREKETSADNQHTELNDCGIAEQNDKTLNSNKLHATRHPSVESEDCDRTSSESAEIPIGSNLRGHHHDKAIILHRRKTKKVRLLTELLCEKGDADNNHFRKEESSSNAISDASADTLSAPQGMVAIQGNVCSMGPNKKRKLPRDEEWRSMGTSFLDNADKRVEVLKRDAETTNATAGPLLENDLFIRMGLLTGMKSDVSKYRSGKSPIIGKKKNGRTHVLDECQPLGPSRMGVPRKNHDETGVGHEGDADDDDVSFRLVHGAFVGREMDLFPLPDQIAKRKSTSCKKNSKVHQSEVRKASLMSWTTCMPKAKEGPSMRKDVQIMPTVAASVPFQSAQLAATDRGLDLSLSSCLAVERCNASYVPQAEGGKTSFLPWQKAIPEDQALMSKHASDGRSKGPHFGFSSKKNSHGAPFFDEKHSHPSLIESGDPSLLQKKDFCNTSNGKKSIKVHEHSLFTRKDKDRAGNGSEQVAMDDVPMDIVELMAKNQYERCLPDAENDKIPSDMANLTRNLQTRDFNKPCSNGAFSSFQEEACHKQKPYAKNGVITRCEILGSAKPKSAENLYEDDINHFSMSQLGQTQRPVGFKAFLQHPEEQSGGFRYSVGSSSRLNGSENCKWIGNMDGKRDPNASCWQTFGPCNTTPGVPQQNKGAKWPYMLPNNSPFIYNVPQKHATSADINLLSRFPNGNPNGERDMNSFNQNAARVGKHKEDCDSKSIGRTHTENLFSCRHDGMKLQHKMMGSLDLYANETIPAMHLLSLMDAGLQSSKPSSMDVNPRFLKKPLMAHDSHPDFLRLDSVVRSPSYDYHSKNKFPENSHEPFPTFPVVGAPASLFQQDRGSKKKVTNLPGEGSWKSQENKKRKTSNSSAQNKGCGPQNSLATGGDTGSGSVPARCKQKMFLGASDPMVFPNRFHGMQGSTKSILEAPSATGTLRPLKRSSETEVCSINRNPADFSLPGAGNLYTIGGEDLKFRAVVTHRNRSGLEKLDGRKRQPKIPSMKQLVQHRA